MPATDTSLSHLLVKINDKAVSEELMSQIVEMEIENDRHLPDSAIIRFHMDSVESDVTELPDVEFKDFMNKSTKIEIIHKGAADTPIFKGEVVSISLEYGMWEPGGAMITVLQAFDRAHRLNLGRKTRAFVQQKYSDIAKKIASEHGLSSQVDNTVQIYDHVFQTNQSDWEFLRQMADRVGYELFVEDTKLYFQKTQKSPGTPIELNWQEELTQFHLRASTNFQVTEVSVKGWDWEKQQAIVGKVSNGNGRPKIGDTRTGTAQAQGAFGKSEILITDIPVMSQDEAKNVAQSVANAIDGEHIYAQGVTARGMGEILPGKLIEIKGIGKRFSGKYYVTSSIHHYTNTDGYSTSFVIGGQRANTLAEMVEVGSRPPNFGGMQGVAIGVVTNNKDEDDLGRVKVKFPWMDDKLESDWIRIATPDAGPMRGFQWLPEVNDEMLLAFEHGDINYPYIIGSLWNGKAKPPEGNKKVVGGDGKVNERIIRSRSGHVIILDDTSGNEKITIRDKTEKNEIVIDSKTNTITLKVDKDISIQANGKIDLTSSRGDISIECNNFSITAKQKCDIKATGQLNLESTSQASIKGAQMSVEGTAKVEIKSNAMASINGGAMTEIKGGLVRIN